MRRIGGLWRKFWKISPLVHLLYKATLGPTFENLYLRNERKDAGYKFLQLLRRVQLGERLDVQTLLLGQAVRVAGGRPLCGVPGDANEYWDGRAVEGGGQVDFML